MDPIALALFASFASLLPVLLLFCLLILLCHQRLRPLSQTLTPKCIESSFPDPTSDPPRIAPPESHNASFDPSLPHFSLSELASATDGFHPSRIIGDGGFGVVYRADLPSGVTVAVKKLNPDAFHGLREFRAEVDTMAVLLHPNIVRILGYSVSGADRLLIYEFIERGSLDEWLYETTPFEGDPLTWKTRVRIILGVANGLGYLHGLARPIVHRDIKAGNVLLDSGFGAHIADFGFARTIEGVDSHKSTQVAGTMGYMPPEYKAGFTAATVKGDVYSFGVLMFEVAARRRPSWPTMVGDGGSDGEVWLVDWARRMAAEGREMEVVDESVPREGLLAAEVAEYFRVAYLCTMEKYSDRPAMEEVIGMLSQIAT